METRDAYTDQVPEEARRERLAALYREVFSSDPSGILALRGDGSERRIYRLRGDGHSVIGIWGDNVPENRAFLGFTASFLRCGLPVPRIHAVASDERAYIEEDLGDDLLFDWARTRRVEGDLNAEAFDMYAEVLRDLVRFQIDAAEAVDYGLCYQWPEFGLEALTFDMQYFREQFLERSGARFDRAAYDEDCGRLITYLLRADRTHFLYRDFQSRNVLVCGGMPRYIDYQSGRRGALHYDAASLLYDAKARIGTETRRALLDEYLAAVSRRLPVDTAEFYPLFDAYAVARVMQALGAFGKLGLYLGKPGFRSSIPPALENLRGLAEHAEVFRALPALRTLFQALPDMLSDHDFSEP
ncbi:MAG: phosphotransferase [Ignavibacteriae bacterium]|nr:phosphotransferase [Ignavibacteriota bacterium]